MALTYITGSVTQGGADAFAQGEITTALSGVGNVAYRIREMLLEITGFSNIDGSSSEIALTRRSKSAMPLITDRDVIRKWKWNSKLTTSGGTTKDTVIRDFYSEDDELLIVEDPLYLSIDGTSTALTLTAYVRIGVERVSISAVDRLTLLTQSLD